MFCSHNRNQMPGLDIRNYKNDIEENSNKEIGTVTITVKNLDVFEFRI